ncbi:PEPxxWA-CTERM sorting domain-containing protein [Sphingomonas mollis]|uniref:PEPxxWA-CTERM sorting domain-containing protein n=1 Tax=Sphingomonas mollis TaxID=2795726 RepID=A0ABS0XUR6_9SPHN|nr:PEPxxWA-CTERM sorting domain-containing protein [Sphingomonas sp. BT553]MBJ6123510.1 PEPxxWA-CTERM sorting domain-containing protein [Sphingomonas sp. BT553]
MKNVVARFAALALTATTVFSASSAQAAKVVYSSSGLFDGSLDGTAFTGKSVEFVGIGDNADTYDAFGEQTTPLSSLRLVLNGITYAIDGKTSVFVSYDDGFAGFIGDGDAGTFGILRFAFNPGVTGASWPVTFFSGPLTSPVVTTGGILIVTAGTDMTFRNSDTISAVPEPSTWLLLIAGFSVVGVALRYRRTDNAPSSAQPRV